MSRIVGRWDGTELKDMFGRSFYIGDYIAKATISDRSGNLSVTKVTRIEEGKMYLDTSKVAVRYPSRLLNLTRFHEGNRVVDIAITALNEISCDWGMDHPVGV